MKDYKDIDLSFNMHPVTKDVTMKSGTWAVLQSVRNIILASLGEWETFPELGAGIYSLLGENASPTIQSDIEAKIKDALAMFEPNRVEIEEVGAALSEDSHTLQIKITFYIVNQPEPISDTIWLRRTN